MRAGPAIAPIAALLGDPARANMLGALMDGRALTVSELAQAGGVALPTASSHLAKLAQAGLLVAEKQGRHRYLSLSGPDVAEVLERLMALAARTAPAVVRTGPNDRAMRHARVCYDHLAGEMGVRLLRRLLEQDFLGDEQGAARLTPNGRRRFEAVGLDLASLESRRRPLCRTCLDWSERRHHLAGALGAAILSYILAKGWARRGPGRTVVFSAPGRAAFERLF